MYLGNQEKRWINEIYRGKALDYFDLLTFTEYYNEDEKRFVVPMEKQRDFEMTVYRCEALLHKLKSNGLIHLAANHDDAEHGIIVYEKIEEELQSETYLNDFIKKFLGYSIVKDTSLYLFINSSFKTKEEIRLEEEIDGRKFAQGIAILIGILSIISSLVAPFIEYILNH